MILEFKDITSKDNSLIKSVSALQSSSKVRREENLFVLEGLRICSDALENGIRFHKLIISRSAGEKYAAAVARFAANADEGYLLPDSLFKRISDTASPQGIMAVASKPVIPKSLTRTGKYIALDNLSDPSNLGAVARTAEALGADGLILTDSGCDPYAPKSLRASMGTLLRVPVIITDSLPGLLKSSGLLCFACVVDATAQKITEVSFAPGSIVIIGNEANGISAEVRAVSDRLVTIPMKGRAESLNAAAAASIVLWEMLK